MTERLSIHKDNSELNNFKAINHVVNMMDWGKVHKVMESLDWIWSSSDHGIPDIYQLKEHALHEAEKYVNLSIENKKDYLTSCGGIQIRTHYFEEGDVALTVQFVLEEWHNYL
jgi:hypothetical protein